MKVGDTVRVKMCDLNEIGTITEVLPVPPNYYSYRVECKTFPEGCLMMNGEIELINNQLEFEFMRE